MADDDDEAAAESEGAEDAGADDGLTDMGVRLVARSADGTKLVNSLDVAPRFELSF